MKSEFYWVIGLITALLPLAVFADVPPVTLQASERIEFQFDYKGDNSILQVILSGTVPDALSLSLFTPQQIAAIARGEAQTPIGQGAVYRDGLRWSGSFPVGEMYHVVVVNKSTAPISFKIEVTGSGVGSLAKVESEMPTARVQITKEGANDVLNIIMPKGITPATLRLTLPPKPKDLYSGKTDSRNNHAKHQTMPGSNLSAAEHRRR